MNHFPNNRFVLLKKSFHLPHTRALTALFEAFSLTERVLLLVLTVLVAGSALVMIADINRSVLVEVPVRGGSLYESIIGSPRFINPLLALSDADRDLSALVYSGLMRATAQGQLVPDLTEHYTISPDGLLYTFVLRDNLTFHDGEPVSADDIIFTVTKAQDPLLKSPRRATWDGVRVEKLDERTVQFTLKQPYAPFLENTTMGILPKHLWRHSTNEQFSFSTSNIEPIGSGPYRVNKVRKDKAGIPHSYTLVPFSDYALGEPYIKELNLLFSINEEELLRNFEHGNNESMHTISGQFAATLEEQGIRIERFTLPRVFAVFFNQNQSPVFARKEVRVALDVALDKQGLVNEVLHGYGTLLEGPIPPGLLPARDATDRQSPKAEPKGRGAETSDIPGIERAKALLEEDGWTFNGSEGVLERKTPKETLTLAFSLATADVPELKAAAEHIAETWETLGARVDVHIFDASDLNQNIIRPRRYDALLFGEIVGRDPDVFAFWHSSQRSDPGLNIALYANISSDKLLEKARAALDQRERVGAYRQFEDEIRRDIPAVFLYAPDFIYVLPEKIKGVSLGSIATPSDRFNDIHRWYIETERVWPFFVK